MNQVEFRYIVLCALVAPAAPSVAVASQTRFYVSPTPGPDANCSLSKPCSLETARDLIRGIDPMPADMHVYLLNGIYERSAPFLLDGAQDSGRNEHTVFYEAYTGAVPRLSGGTQVSGWGPFENSIWRAEVPANFRTRDLFVNAIRAERSRGPYKPVGYAVETGWGYSAPDASMANWRNQQDIEVVSYNEWKAFRCGVNYITGNQIVMDQPCWCLAGNGHPDTPIMLPTWFENAYELLVSLGRPGEWYHDRSPASDGKYYIYYIPRQGETLDQPQSTLVIAPKLESLVIGTGTSATPLENVVFKGLSFINTTWLAPSDPGGYPALVFGSYFTEYPGCTLGTNQSISFLPASVSFTYARGVHVKRCTFARLGATALEFKGGSKDNVIEGNLFKDIGGSAIRLGDPQPETVSDLTAVAENNIISDNYVTDIGRRYFDAQGINVQHARGTTIEHNELHNVPYSGIGVGWTHNSDSAADNLISGNRAHNVLQRLRDGGAAYVISNQEGSSIDGNYLHDVIYRPSLYLPPTPPYFAPFAPVYLDYGTIFTTVDSNVLLSAASWLIVNMSPTQDPPHDNTVTNTYTDIATYHCHGAPCVPANEIEDPTIFQVGQWPAPAATIMSAAGPAAGFADMVPKQFRIEAEDFIGGEGSGYHDLSPGNGAYQYRPDTPEVPVGVDIWQTWGVDVSLESPMIIGASNDHFVGYIQNGEWLKYYIDTPSVFSFSGTIPYTFTLWVRSGIPSNNTVQVQVDAGSVHTLALPVTTPSGALTKVGVPGIFDLTPGGHTVTITFLSSQYDGMLALDAFTYTRP